jgi:hypothetical protein
VLPHRREEADVGLTDVGQHANGPHGRARPLGAMTQAMATDGKSLDLASSVHRCSVNAMNSSFPAGALVPWPHARTPVRSRAIGQSQADRHPSRRRQKAEALACARARRRPARRCSSHPPRTGVDKPDRRVRARRPVRVGVGRDDAAARVPRGHRVVAAAAAQPRRSLRAKAASKATPMRRRSPPAPSGDGAQVSTTSGGAERAPRAGRRARATGPPHRPRHRGSPPAAREPESSGSGRDPRPSDPESEDRSVASNPTTCTTRAADRLHPWGAFLERYRSTKRSVLYWVILSRDTTGPPHPRAARVQDTEATCGSGLAGQGA